MKKLFLLLLLLFAASVADATTYYVRTGGSDGHSCSSIDDDAHAKLTINAGIGCLSGGDTLTVHTGTYTSILDPNGTPAITVPSGSAGAPTILQAASGETVTWRPSGGGGAGDGIWLSSGTAYVTFRNFIWDGTNVTNSFIRVNGTANHIVMTALECKLVPTGNCVFLQDDTSNFNEVSHSYIHDNGGTVTNQYHGVYVRSSNNLIEHNTITHNGGYGIHIYYDNPGGYPNNNTVRFNQSCSNVNGAGVVVGQGDGNLVYSNIFCNNGDRGVQVGFGATNTGVYNNTIYGTAANYGVDIQAGVTGTLVKNNIVWASSAGNGRLINNAGTSTTLTTNLCGSGCAINSDPLVVNAGAQNYNLQASSPAIGIGADLSAIFTKDYAGNTWTVPWGSGSYQYITPGGPIIVKLPASPTGLRLGSATSLKIGQTP